MQAEWTSEGERKPGAGSMRDGAGLSVIKGRHIQGVCAEWARGKRVKPGGTAGRFYSCPSKEICRDRFFCFFGEERGSYAVHETMAHGAGERKNDTEKTPNRHGPATAPKLRKEVHP